MWGDRLWAFSSVDAQSHIQGGDVGGSEGEQSTS